MSEVIRERCAPVLIWALIVVQTFLYTFCLTFAVACRVQQAEGESPSDGRPTTALARLVFDLADELADFLNLDDLPPLAAALLASAAMGLLLTAVVAIARGRLAPAWLRAKPLRNSVLTALPLLAILLFLTHDAPAPETDFSWADIPPPTVDAEASDAALRRLLDNGNGPQLDLTGVNLTFRSDDLHRQYLFDPTNSPIEYASMISNAWTEAGPLRDMVAELDDFDQIADLRERWDSPDLDSYYTRVVQLKHLYNLYSYMQIEAGEPWECVESLAQWHSVARKAMRHRRISLDRWLWAMTLDANIKLVNQLLDENRLDAEHRATLGLAFTPLSQEEVSSRTSRLGEYLILQGAWEREIERHGIAGLDLMWSSPQAGPSTRWWKRAVSRALRPVLLQRNRMSARYRDRLARAFAADPNQPPSAALEGLEAQTRDVRNLLGECYLDLVFEDQIRAAARPYWLRRRSEALWQKLQSPTACPADQRLPEAPQPRGRSTRPAGFAYETWSFVTWLTDQSEY